MHGREAYLRWFEDLVEVWDQLALQPAEVIDLGDRVFGASRITGQGRRSGVALDLTLFQVATQRNGMIVRLREFAERESAPEQPGCRSRRCRLENVESSAAPTVAGPA